MQLNNELKNELIAARDAATDADLKNLLRRALREIEGGRTKSNVEDDMARLNYEAKRYDYFVKLAKTFATSTMIPPDMTEADIFYVIELGDKLGLSAPQALQSIASINGRPAIWGDGMNAVVRASGLCKYIEETEDHSGDIANAWATCKTLRRGETEPVSVTFTMKMAMQAGLYPGKEKSAWGKYPFRMLQMRARAWCLRDVYADALRGLSSAEEQMDIVQTGNEIELMPVSQPVTQPVPDMAKAGAETAQRIEHQVSDRLEFSLDDMITKLRDASDMQSLLTAKALVKKYQWTDEDKTKINAVYSARRTFLKEPAKPAEQKQDTADEKVSAPVSGK